jgi:hypothetical protein
MCLSLCRIAYELARQSQSSQITAGDVVSQVAHEYFFGANIAELAECFSQRRSVVTIRISFEFIATFPGRLAHAVFAGIIPTSDAAVEFDLMNVANDHPGLQFARGILRDSD